MTAYFKFTKIFLANLVFLKRAIFYLQKIYCNDQVILLKIFCKIFLKFLLYFPKGKSNKIIS